jgi:four helix bundle protein
MAKSHRELEVWQLADQIRRVIVALTAKPSVRGDYDFCKQALSASRSACRNTAEGFYRFGHPEFAHFVNIARASLGELLESVEDARLANYLDGDQCDALEGKIQHAIAAASSLYTHLITTPTPPRAPKRTKVPKPSK